MSPPATGGPPTLSYAGRRVVEPDRPGGTVSAQLVLGGLDEETAFVEYDVGCDADIILGHDSCARTTTPSSTSQMRLHFGQRVRLNLMLDVAASPATPAKSAEARVLLCTVGLGAVPTLGRPTR